MEPSKNMKTFEKVKKLRSFGVNSILAILITFVIVISLTGCGDDTSKITREDYNNMMEIVSLNDDFDLIDVRSALYSFVPKFLNAESYKDLQESITYIEKYSTSLLQSSLKLSNYTARAERREVEGIYYCYPENSNNGKGRFLVVTSAVGDDGSFLDNTRAYMMFSLDSEGKLTQVERW